ncbi:MAG: ABC transporter ATP-binding protein [Bacteroidia bacterium]|nr:ABC transporter ATP-binding protein [Bacteroidia bacterium]MDW8347968.1 ABC transporter ATP-binding protein [Bacteroidia bacterium]
MFIIQARELSKKYQTQRIFDNFSATFEQGRKYAIIGPNGSGKSTLLKTLSNYSSADKGKLQYLKQGRVIQDYSIFTHISYAAPYVNLFREFTVAETLHWVKQSKGLTKEVKDILEITQLHTAKHKYVKYLSSGMYQRLKLAAAIFTIYDVLFLDEPCTNLDQASIQLYQEWIHSHTDSKIVIIASNQLHEYQMCDTILDMLNYKL